MHLLIGKSVTSLSEETLYNEATKTENATVGLSQLLLYQLIVHYMIEIINNNIHIYF